MNTAPHEVLSKLTDMCWICEVCTHE